MNLEMPYYSYNFGFNVSIKCQSNPFSVCFQTMSTCAVYLNLEIILLKIILWLLFLHPDRKIKTGKDLKLYVLSHCTPGTYSSDKIF